ncbi:MAG: ADP-ribosyl-[dinitrogen reductase] hydrolase [Deltaproteobacteria bacterium]|nr:ADP-ribosyl-[dinitrogen reductase] hydrolase [Deltaproteobacteria bacterium]
MNTITIQDRQKGSFVGLATGDALGAPVEFSFRDRFPELREMISGGKFQLPAGSWTDDTSMSLCLADSLLHHPDLNPKDLLTRFWSWASTGENSATGKAIGFGQNVLQSLFDFHRTGILKAGEKHRRSDGNGSIMRLAPMILLYAQNPSKGARLAREQSYTTHASDIAADGCECLFRIVHGLFHGKDLEKSLEESHRSTWHSDIQAITAQTWKEKSRAEILSTGYVAATLEAAVWCVGTTSSFEEALIKAVNLAHDADTVAAVTGQIAGALYGYSTIPPRWLRVLAKRDHIELRAQQLISASEIS